ncbi:hypothetical protein FRC12_022035, partial [Ceratobasidium sp. 428]
MEDEKLDGDNQYDCSICGSKQDAFRYQRIAQLPPILHFSVLRFVFDPKDMERKKSKQAINYPLSINMRPFVDGQKSDLWYDLRGVLLHRGASAYHGHYEAQVFDVTRNKWFLFNDEEVNQIQKEDLLGRQISGTFRAQGSKDAYMLIYGRRERRTADAHALSLPKHVSQTVEKLNAEHTASRDTYAEKKQNLESEFTTIRNLKREIFQSWQISSADEVSVVLAREDLEKWVSGDLDTTKAKEFARSPTIDNDPLPQDTGSTSQQVGHKAASPSPPPLGELIRRSVPPAPNGVHTLESSTIKPPFSITCFHDLLDPSKSASMKRISKNAWERIQKSGIKAAALESTQVCEDCTIKQFNEKLYALQHAKALANFEASMLEDKSREWWISKAWLKDWKLKRPKMHKPGFRDPIPNTDQFKSDIYCEHEGLVHSQRSREKISTTALSVLQDIFPEFNPPNVETETCSVCEAVAVSDREATRETRAKAEAER